MRATLTAAVLMCIAVSAMAQIANIDERLVNISFLAPPVEIKNLHAGPVAPNWASDAHKAEVPDPTVLPIYLQVDNISPKTVQNVHYQIKTKLGVRTDIELARLAMKLKLIG